jgi:hypothetical protein
MLRRLLALAVLLLPASLYAQGAGTPAFRGQVLFPLTFTPDNTYDIGASGATRPRTGYFGTSVVTPALTVSGLTSGRVPVAGTGGLLGDFSGLTFDGTSLTATRVATAAGSCANVSYRMTDNDTGLAEITAANWAWCVNGTERARLGSGGDISSTGGFLMGTSVSGADTSLNRISAGVAAISSGASRRHLMGGGAAVASAAALPAPVAALYHITGTTNITSITSTNIGTGTCITLIFDGVLTFTNGGNLVIGTDYITTANDNWHGCFDGTNWHELSRKAN